MTKWKPTLVAFLASQAVSLVGSAVVAYAVIWHVALTTKSGWSYTLIALAGLLPQGVMSLFGGVWADRHSRKALVIAADAITALVTLAAAAALWSGAEPSLLLLGLTLFLRGLSGGVQLPAEAAIVPTLVPDGQLLRVNSANGAIQAVVLLGSPALAGVLLSFGWELAWLLMIDVVTAAAAIVILAFIAVPKPQSGERRRLTAELAETWRYGLGHRVLKRVLLLALGLYVLILAPTQLTPIMVVRLFGEEPWKLATVEVAWSAGLIAGGAILAVWGGLRNRMAMIIAMSVVWGIFTAALGLAPWYWLFAAIWVVFGISGAALQAATMTVVQEETPPALLGRMMGVTTLIGNLAGPVGLLAVGPLADVVSVRTVFVVCGLLAVAVTICLAVGAPPQWAPGRSPAAVGPSGLKSERE
ncbi:MAG: MFS transporter [Propionibacteriaceae bacterium]|jgi:DHA3 family macrolide efflux protein-like MFS transporter|nr:MFS transporter [Propionibacteriaceae bacterium]